VIIPVFVVVFYSINLDRMSDDDFMEKYGETYAGMAPKRPSIFFACFFLLRRYMFVLTISTIAVMVVNVWLGIAVQILTCLFSTIFLLTFTPFEETLIQNLEVFNEITGLVLLYHVLYFTPILPSVEMQANIGYSFIFCMGANMATHLFFLLRASFRDCNRKYKVKKAKRRAKEIKIDMEDEKEITEDFSVLHPKSMPSRATQKQAKSKIKMDFKLVMATISENSSEYKPQSSGADRERSELRGLSGLEMSLDSDERRFV